MGKKSLQAIHHIRDYYPECTKSSKNQAAKEKITPFSF
jgi:hypothetical protein